MKTKIYLIMLFFCAFSGFAFSPPLINNPSPLEVCDENNDGFASFDLTVKIPEILGSLNPANITVNFYETQVNAEANTAPILPATSYYNIVPFTITLYVRVEDNTTGEYSITTLQLQINSAPIINPNITDYYVNDNPYDGIGVFDLTTKDAEIVFGDPTVFTTYYPTLIDAQINANVITTPTSYVNMVNPQTIGVRIENPTTGCSQIGSFKILVSDGLPIVTPSEYRICDVGNDTSEIFDLTTKNNEILTHLDPALYTVNYYLTFLDSANDVNVIPNPAAYALSTITETVYARVFENANPANFALTSLALKIVPMPTGTISGPATVCQGELAVITFIGANSAAPYSFYYNTNSVASNVATASFGNTVSIYVNTSTPGIYNYDLIAVLSQNEAYCYNSVSGSVTVQVQAAPVLAGPVPNLSVEDIPYDGSATFNITSYESIILTNQTGATIAYYTSQLDAQAENNPIATPSAFVANNGQQIWFRLNYPSGCPLISSFHLYVTNPDIVFIPDPNFKAKLIAVGVDTNSDGEIQFTEALAATSLNVSNAFISDLTGIQSFTNLQELNCDANPLNQLSINGLSMLSSLSCNECSLTSLNLTNLSMETLYCQNNALTNLDLSTVILANLYASSNPNLLSINLKNGSTEQYLEILNGNTALQYICVDFGEETYIQNQINISGIPNTITLNSYCSFTPSGDFNTITGIIRFDADNNGCDASDEVQPNVRVNINDGTNQGATFTDSNGNYRFYTTSGNFTLTPSMENASWYNFSPSSANIAFVDANNNSTTQNFCITANGVHPDVEVVIVPITPARPGFNAEYQLVYKNKGNQTVNGVNTFSYDDTKIDFVSASQNPDFQTTGNIQWDFGVLQPFESRSIEIILNVNAPTETPAVNLGDVLTFTANANIVPTDENPADNSFTLNQTVIGSFDPNDITCIEGALVSPLEIGNYLHYVINFENTGTADAENIVVREVIDTNQFDISSLQILNSSDAVSARITGNIAEFIFQNINLRSGGHGNILLKIKSNNTLHEGDQVLKKANIYFDYNYPIETNNAVTVFQTLSSPDFETDASITVYPNPTKGNININCNNTIKSVQLYDVQGRVLQTNLVNQNKTTLDITNQSNGIYFVKVLSDKGIEVQRIVKE